MKVTDKLQKADRNDSEKKSPRGPTTPVRARLKCVNDDLMRVM